VLQSVAPFSEMRCLQLLEGLVQLLDVRNAWLMVGCWDLIGRV
jgi:hypothetical protein